MLLYTDRKSISENSGPRKDVHIFLRHQKSQYVTGFLYFITLKRLICLFVFTQKFLKFSQKELLIIIINICCSENFNNISENSAHRKDVHIHQKFQYVTGFLYFITLGRPICLSVFIQKFLKSIPLGIINYNYKYLLFRKFS